jgi:hypothetical protein
MTQTIDENLRVNIWEEKLTQELNYRCFSKLGGRITCIDSFLRYALAVSSLSTVVFWLLIDPSGSIWKWLSAISSILAVLNASIQYQRNIECISKEKAAYLKIWKDFDALWLQIQSNTITSKKVMDTRKKLLDMAWETEKTNTIHNISKAMIKKCEHEVRIHNRIGEK